LGLWDQPVKPIDPFWENFSTENLRDFANGLVDADKKKTVINLARFGTLYQPLDEVKIDGKTLKVQGFITPHGKTSKVALAQYFPKLKVNDGDTIAFDGAVPACGSTTLKSSNTGGFYFYRGKRCINFGGDAYNNHGWYDLKDPIASAWATRLRIRVQYEDDLDDKLELHPNKNRFNDIADIVWQRIKTRLQPRIGGEAFRAAPYDEARQFCLWPGEGDSQFSVMNSSIWDYKLCSDCTLLIHDKNEYCGTETCDTCGEDPTINTCLRDACRTACTHCSEVGEHKSDECPTLFCDECEFHHPPEEEHYCPDCKFQECECPEEGEGEEEGEDDEGDDDEGDEDDEALLGHYEFDDGFAYAELPKDARQWCIDTLKQILSDLEIDIAELE
jgi:hypothetical protein